VPVKEKQTIGREFMKCKALIRFAVVFILFVLPGRLAAQYVHQDLKSGKKQVKNVLILPPEANLVKSGMKGAEPLVDESRSMERGVYTVVAKSLTEKGYNVLANAFSVDALDQNSDLKYALTDLQTRYDKLLLLMKKKPKGVRTGRFVLGDEVANLSQGGDADALVFVRANGYLPTAGLKTFVIVTGMGVTRNHAQVASSVVDAQTGTVLYFGECRVYGNFVGDPDSMKVKIYNSLSDFRPDYPNKH
jgi:hypothetical protein